MHLFGRSLPPVLTCAIAAVVVAGTTAAASGTAAGAPTAVPRYDHIFVIVEENHGFQDVIGNPAAPNLNALASQFGLATQYFGVSHPSEPNYVGLMGGGTFGVASDDPYSINRVDGQQNLATQLDAAGISWKAYLQGLPHPGYRSICYPAKCNGAPDIDPLYVSKHDGIQNFTAALNDRDWGLQVPVESALSTSDVWAVGQQEGANGKFETLVEHFDGVKWSAVPSPDPGSTGNNLYGVKAVGPDDVWAVGERLGDAGPDRSLVEHWNGTSWSVVPSAGNGSASGMLFGVTAGDGGVWAVGETDDQTAGARPLIQRLDGDSFVNLPVPASAGSIFTSLWAVAESQGTVWAVGTFEDVVSTNNEPLILRGSGDRFTVVNGPTPNGSAGGDIIGGVAATGDTVWAVGTYDTGGNRLTLTQRRLEP